ncbi:MAG: hypothetical protein WC655_01415 [Candidatus Hydrogenedentales bacterium]
MLQIFLLTLAVFGLGIAAMVLGTWLTGHCLRGSCGGEGAVGPNGELLTCGSCPRKKNINHAHAPH